MRNKKKLLRQEALKLWYNKYLKNSCEVCGSNYILQAHHFYYRSSYGHLAFEKENHITLCRKCHFILHHQDPKKIENKIREIRGEKWYKKLQKMAQNRPKGSYLTTEWYKEQIKKLEKRKKIDQ